MTTPSFDLASAHMVTCQSLNSWETLTPLLWASRDQYQSKETCSNSRGPKQRIFTMTIIALCKHSYHRKSSKTMSSRENNSSLKSQTWGSWPKTSNLHQWITALKTWKAMPWPKRIFHSTSRLISKSKSHPPMCFNGIAANLTIYTRHPASMALWEVLIDSRNLLM